jgi:hypothetical protein
MKTQQPFQVIHHVPVPEDLTSVRSIHDGVKWIRGVYSDSVRVDHDVLTFTVRWGNDGGKRRFTVATDLIGGYECDI